MPQKKKNKQNSSNSKKPQNLSTPKKSQNLSTLNVHHELTVSANSANMEPNASSKVIEATAEVSVTSVVSSKMRNLQISNSGKCLNLPKNSSNASYENSEKESDKNLSHKQNEESNKGETEKSLSDEEDAWDDNEHYNKTNSRSFKEPKQSSESSHNVSYDNSESESDKKLPSKHNEELIKGETEQLLSDDSAWNDEQYNKTNSKSFQKSKQSSEHNLSRHEQTSSSVGHRQASSSCERKAQNEDYDIFTKRYVDKDMEFQVVNEVQGDLFEADHEYSLGHCVAEDMNMGSGIATTFRQTFKKVDELLNQRQKQGGLAVLEIKNRFIYYLVTKRASTGKPSLYTLWCSLQKMKNHMVQNNVKKLALPRIGCGLDGLEWSRVKRMLEYIFKNIDDVEIRIFNFQQDIYGAPPARVRKCPVVNEAYPITDIAYGSVIIYFGSEDGVETEEIKSLNIKFPYISNIYRTEKKVVGTYIRTDRHRDGYCFYGCIVRKSHTDPFNFSYFQKCLNSLQVQNRKDKYEYMAFQAFMEDGSTFIVSKIVNLMRNSLTYIEVYVCWPKELQGDMPPPSK